MEDSSCLNCLNFSFCNLDIDSSTWDNEEAWRSNSNTCWCTRWLLEQDKIWRWSSRRQTCSQRSSRCCWCCFRCCWACCLRVNSWKVYCLDKLNSYFKCHFVLLASSTSKLHFERKSKGILRENISIEESAVQSRPSYLLVTLRFADYTISQQTRSTKECAQTSQV